MRVYVDTNILMDYLKGRNIKANIFFKNALECLFEIIISDLTLRELNTNKLDFGSHLVWLKALKKLEFIQTTTEDQLAAENNMRVLNTHFADSLHQTLALRANADCLLTQNKRDFLQCEIAKNYNELGIK